MVNWKNLGVGLIGNLLGLSPLLIQIILGVDPYRAGRNIGEWLVGFAQNLENYRLILSMGFFLGLILSIIGGYFLQNRVDVLARVIRGFSTTSILLYLGLDLLFFRGAMIIVPFFIGTILLFSVFMEYGCVIDTGTEPRIKKSELKIKFSRTNIRRGVVAILSILLIFPFLPSIFLISANLPSAPFVDDLYDVKRISYEQAVNPEFMEFIVPEYKGNSWKTYLYIPLGVDESVPIYVFIHGHSGSDTKYYDNILRTVSSRGVLTIFVQYSSYYDEAKYSSYLQKNGIQIPAGEVSANYYRYAMEMDGLVEFFNRSNSTGDDLKGEIDSYLPMGYDTSRLMIGGHSLGGGMTLYVMDRLLGLGMGTSKLLVDIEAGWVSSFESNMSALPEHTIVSVVAYQDDVVVPACIPAGLFERLYSRDGTNFLPDDQVSFFVVQSDFHGYPRDLANHYSPTDLIKFNIYNQLLVRLSAMADFLSGRSTSTDFLTNLDMGVWSDGTTFNPMIRSTDPLGLRSDGIYDLVTSYDSEYCNG